MGQKQSGQAGDSLQSVPSSALARPAFSLAAGCDVESANEAESDAEKADIKHERH